MDEYMLVENPKELLSFMNGNISYGYLSKTGRVYRYGDNDFDKNWYKEYILESKDDILTTKCGNCFDQTELERDWFSNNGYQFITIFEMVKLDYENDYPTHSFLVYKDDNDKWNWFENSDYKNRGIHTFNKLADAIECQYKCYIEQLREYNIKGEEIDKIIITEFLKPKYHANAREYLEHVINSKKIK